MSDEASPPATGNGEVRKIIHLDMDAFYASVEQRDDPSLRGRPVVVGGPPESRGVVAAASYEARAYGVRSAMPSAEAYRRCPEAVFLRPRMSVYASVSREVRTLLEACTPLIEPLSIDEWFLDVTENSFGLPYGSQVAQKLRAQIKEQVGLTASAGVASVKFVAKIASAARKPDGLTVVPPDQTRQFLAPLPVSALWGVGPKLTERLNAAGYHTIGQLAETPEERLRARLGKVGGGLWRLSHGLDERRVRPHRQRKSIGTEQTFAENLMSMDALSPLLHRMVEKVAQRLTETSTLTKRVTVKIRYSDFKTHTFAKTLEQPTRQANILHETAEALLKRTQAGFKPVRLLGFSAALWVRQSAKGQLWLPFTGEAEGS